MPDANLFQCPFCFDDQFACPPERLPYGCNYCFGATTNNWWTKTKRYLGFKLHCTHCHEPLDLRQRTCACEANLLPREYLDGNHHIIGIIGNTYVGKSVYLTTLIETLKTRANVLNLSVSEVNEHTRRTYHKDYRDPLYNRQVLPEATRSTKSHDKSDNPENPKDTEKSQNTGKPKEPEKPKESTESEEKFMITPLIFRIRFNTNTTGLVDFHLFFYDASGEDLVEDESWRDYLRFIEHCSAFIWLIGPANLNLPGDYGVSEAKAETATEPYRTVDLITQYLQTRGQTEEELKQIPVAVCLNKLDLLQNQPELAHQQWLFEPLRYPPPDPDSARYPEELIESEKKRVHDTIYSLIDLSGNANFLQYVRQTFPRHALFGISCLGQAPVRDAASNKQKLDGPPKPNRVELPLLWLLHQLELFPQMRTDVS